jgi:hypothetical protein
MDTLALFGISVAFSFAAWGMVTARYVWPKLRILPQRDAPRPLLTLHGSASWASPSSCPEL